MPKLKSQLERGRWPESRVQVHIPTELSPRARQQAAEAIALLESYGVMAVLDAEGQIRFRGAKRPPGHVALLAERLSDSIEAFLQAERAALRF